MKIYGRTQPLAKYTIHECLRVIRKLGFDGGEICLENKDISPEMLNDKLIEGIRDLMAESGMKSYSVSYHKDYVYNDSLFEQTKKVIGLVRKFGTEVFVFGGPTKKTKDQEEWKLMVNRTRELMKISEDHGVIMANEFEPGFVIGSTEELIKLFNDVPSPNLAANMDLGHVFLCDPDPIGAIHKVGKKIAHCHIENMKAGVHDHLLPYEGDMDLKVYLQALADVGFKGGMALDLYKHDYEAVAGESIEYIRGLLKVVAEFE
jgi:sugar phosphate isomerase/epimerase